MSAQPPGVRLPWEYGWTRRQSEGRVHHFVYRHEKARAKRQPLQGCCRWEPASRDSVRRARSDAKRPVNCAAGFLLLVIREFDTTHVSRLFRSDDVGTLPMARRVLSLAHGSAVVFVHPGGGLTHHPRSDGAGERTLDEVPRNTVLAVSIGSHRDTPSTRRLTPIIWYPKTSATQGQRYGLA